MPLFVVIRYVQSIMSKFQMTIFHQGEQRSSQFDRFDSF